MGNVKKVSLVLALCMGLVSLSAVGEDSHDSSTNDKGSTFSFSSLTDLFSPKSAKLKKLMEDNDVDGALAYYNEESNASNVYSNYFLENQDSNRDLLKQLAAKVNAKYEADIQPLRATLQGYAAMDVLPETSWKALKSVLEEVGKKVDAYNNIELIARIKAKSAVMAELVSMADKIRSQLAIQAKDMFLAYDWYSSVSFYDVYPGNQDAKAIFTEASPVIRDKVCAVEPAKLVAFKKTYEASIPAELNDALMTCYLNGVTKSGLASGKRGLAGMLSTLSKAKEAGFQVKNMPGAKLAFIQVTSKTLLSEGAIEFPAEITVDLPFDSSTAELDTALSSNADFLVVFDVANASTQRRIQKREEQESKVLARMDRVPNNDYESARMKVNEAQNGLNNAQSQYAQGLGGALVKAVAVGMWSGRLKESQETFAKTQSYKEAPYYEPYKYASANVDVRKVMTVNYYVIDKQDRNYYKGTFDVSDSRSFHVAYNINDKDPDKSSLLSRFDREEDLEKFEKAGVSVKLSALVDSYVKNPGAAVALGSLESLRSKMLVDKNKALAQNKSNKFDARPLNDPRFDSVVVIINLKGGLGTGVYVKPDLVLTNYHVIEGVKFVELKLYNGMETFGKVVKSDVRLDLALIKVETRGKPVDFYTGNTIDVGSTVEAIGHPNGLRFSITRGVISALRKLPSIYATGGKEVLFIQTDAAINPGNSGGPLFLGNKVIGINDQKLVKAGLEGLGFSIHYSEVDNFMRETF